MELWLVQLLQQQQHLDLLCQLVTVSQDAMVLLQLPLTHPSAPLAFPPFEEAEEDWNTYSVESGWGLEPSFDVSAMTEVRVPLGGTALLPCRVRHLAGRPVAWVRRRDWHILTWGAASFTSDGRFRVLSSHSGRDWSLRIRHVQRHDNGTYECQVPTGSGTKSHLFNLHVVVPRAVILGRREYHVGEGSTVSLVCIIDNGPLVAQFTFWKHNDRTVVADDAASKGMSVATDADGARPHSRLLISRADVTHAGSYTCGAPGADPDTVHLFISQVPEKEPKY
ncbi:hemicentin-1-like [Schistocerca americana]|uniref:hemicentin-1-like n=1 Tax=Schistocerca americana TaxID=7009 RepID=UPI001F50166A|nr:hemicentin-1-like [Schistocerca americana]